MSYHLNKGDLFFSYEKDIWLDNVGICNPVNTVGVMGAGLALEFKRRYPDLFPAYKKACDEHVFDSKGYFVYQTDKTNIACIYTKKDWKNPSTLEYIRDSLSRFDADKETHGIDRLYLPALGCGHGGLNWHTQVFPLLKEILENSNVKYEIIVPSSYYPSLAYMKERHGSIFFTGDVMLSPTFIRPFVFQNMQFFSIVHALVYFKTKYAIAENKLNPHVITVLDGATEKDIKKRVHLLKETTDNLNVDKFNNVKSNLLYRLCDTLISQHREVQTALFSTSDFPLVYLTEDTWLGIGQTPDNIAILGTPDYFKGYNELGHIWMDLRKDYCKIYTKWPDNYS